MLACVDAHYQNQGAMAACVLFRTWSDHAPADQRALSLPAAAPYVPGQLYRRELPCILAVLAEVAEPPELIVIDGYVWLRHGHPGLGAHLYDALARSVPVVGVAKSRFRGADEAIAVVRGGSRKPLIVSAAGIDPHQAAVNVRSMHGRHRIPTLLKLADRLARGGGTG